MRSVAAAITLVILGAGSLPAFADDVEVPAGTSVPLKFLAPMDSATVKEGIPVQFEVAADVLIGRSVIFRKGTPVEGTVTDVSQPGIFGQSARVHIGFIKATAVDGRPVGLSPLDVTPESIKQVKDVGTAAGSSVAGAILLGPIGIAAGAFIHGGQVSIPAGAVGIAKVGEAFKLALP